MDVNNDEDSVGRPSSMTVIAPRRRSVLACNISEVGAKILGILARARGVPQLREEMRSYLVYGNEPMVDGCNTASASSTLTRRKIPPGRATARWKNAAPSVP